MFVVDVVGVNMLCVLSVCLSVCLIRLYWQYSL